MNVNKCWKCGYNWEPRVQAPVECPACKSRRWSEKKELAR